MKQPNEHIGQILSQAAITAGIPESIIRSVAYHESRYNPKAESKAGAKGLMQIMPFNFQKYGITDPFDPVQSANAGASMLSGLFDKFASWERALAAYVWGPGNVKKHPNPNNWPDNVKAYVTNVLKGANLPVSFFLPNSEVSPHTCLVQYQAPFWHILCIGFESEFTCQRNRFFGNRDASEHKAESLRLDKFVVCACKVLPE